MGCIFRLAKTVKEYNMSNNVMTSISDPKNNGYNSKVIQSFNIDLSH